MGIVKLVSFVGFVETLWFVGLVWGGMGRAGILKVLNTKVLPRSAKLNAFVQAKNRF